MSYIVSDSDFGVIQHVLKRLTEFRDEWTTREDDPEEMWTEAPEMATDLVMKLGPAVSRISVADTGADD